jgi:hypothetical protein
MVDFSYETRPVTALQEAALLDVAWFGLFSLQSPYYYARVQKRVDAKFM